MEWNLPKKIEKLVIAWAELYQEQLLEDWDLMQDNKQPIKINPLDK